MTNRFTLLLLLSLTIACGSKREPGSLVGACDQRARMGRCSEYFGDYYASSGIRCESGGGTALATCPKDGALLRCAQQVGKEDEWHALWYGPKKTKEEAEQLCSLPGQQVRTP